MLISTVVLGTVLGTELFFAATLGWSAATRGTELDAALLGFVFFFGLNLVSFSAMVRGAEECQNRWRCGQCNAAVEMR